MSRKKNISNKSIIKKLKMFDAGIFFEYQETYSLQTVNILQSHKFR